MNEEFLNTWTCVLQHRHWMTSWLNMKHLTRHSFTTHRWSAVQTLKSPLLDMCSLIH